MLLLVLVAVNKASIPTRAEIEPAEAVLELLAGNSADEVAERAGVSLAQVLRWREQFVAGGRLALAQVVAAAEETGIAGAQVPFSALSPSSSATAGEVGDAAGELAPPVPTGTGAPQEDSPKAAADGSVGSQPAADESDAHQRDTHQPDIYQADPDTSKVTDQHQATSVAGCRVELFGPPRFLVQASQRELQWPLRRALELVAYLALAPAGGVRREELAAAIWPEASADRVQRNFHPTLSIARRVLAEGLGSKTLLYRQGSYRLAPEVDWWVDVDHFLALADAGQELAAMGEGAAAARTLSQAWRLYRGPLLEGWSSPWLERRREELHHQYIQVLRRLAWLWVDEGEDPRALDALRAILIHEPFEEAVHRSVMEIYGRQGRRDLVRRQFIHLQDLLAELNVEPAEQTQERYHALMR